MHREAQKQADNLKMELEKAKAQAEQLRDENAALKARLGNEQPELDPDPAAHPSRGPDGMPNGQRCTCLAIENV